MIAVRYVILSYLICASWSALHAEEPKPRDTWKIEFAGNEYFNADGIRTGLALDRATQLAAADALPMEQYLDLLRRRIIRGYQSNGFRDVQVAMNLDRATGVITSNILEGQRWTQGEVSVAGLSDRECEYVASLIRQKSDHSTPLQERQPKLEFWNTGSEMSFVDAAQDLYQPTVQEALTAIGYPQAQFTIVCPVGSEADEHSVNLQIMVTDTGVSLTVGEIIFTGLEKHSSEQMIEFLELRSGMPMTLMLREQIVSKLLTSGRFLMAEVTHERFYFDPAEPLDLNIRIREYDMVAPLGEQLTEVQQTLMKTSDWLSKWSDNGQDLHVKVTASNEVVKVIVPQQYHSFCDPALGTGIPGTLCVDFLTSPKDGSVLTLQVIDAQGTVSVRRTILLTGSTQGLVAWQHKKKWLQSSQMSFICTQSMLGQWGSKDDPRAKFQFGYGIDWDPGKGLKSEFQTTAAAVMHLLNGGSPDVVFEADRCRIAWEAGVVELQRDSGAIRRISAHDNDASVEFSSASGLVQAEVSRLMEETKDWPNQCQPGREWPALAAMILDDVKAAELERSDAIVLGLDLLGNEAALERFSTGMELLEDRRTLVIPQENSRPTVQVAGFLRYIPLLSNLVPAGSFPNRLGLAVLESQSTENTDPIMNLLLKLFKEDFHGAIYCDLVARLYPNTGMAAMLAKVGLARLSTAEFQRDMAPFVSEQGHVRETLCALLVWLQQTSDDEAEKIARLADRHLKNQNGTAINVRPLLVLIRSQHGKSPEDVLPSLVPVVWECGLRAWVEADLTSLASPVPTKSSKYVSRASGEIQTPFSIDFNIKAARRERSKAKVSIQDKGKTDSGNNILEQQWDLDDPLGLKEVKSRFTQSFPGPALESKKEE